MILKHKDRELLHFDWVKPFGVCHVTLNEKSSQYLPIEFRDKASHGVTRDLVWGLEDWLLHRTAPMNRRFVRDVLTSAGFNPSDPGYLRRLIEFCSGLSINDVHWVVPDDFRGTWAECNLYKNAFPESVAAMAFSGIGNVRAHDITTSPEYTTNGVLAKCWRRREGKIELWKAGSNQSHGLEPFAEFYAAQVAKALGIDHVPYRLAQYKNRICSVCPIFTNERTGFIPVGKLLTREEITADTRFANIFLLDALILNDDRHLGNFGFLIDNETNEITGVAPAFDNGHSLFSRPPERFTDGSPALYEDWTSFPGLNRDKAINQLERLRDFKLRKDSRFNLSDSDFHSAADMIARRIETLVNTYSQTTTSGPVKVEFTGPLLLLNIIRYNPGLRTVTLAKLANITPRTAKRYLAQLHGQIVFKGAPKTGGYFIATPASSTNLHAQ